MTTLRKAAQQALEALQEYQSNGAPFLACDRAATALRAALAQQDEPCPNCASLEAQNDELDRKLAELEQDEPTGKQSLQVESVQGPVAWRYKPMIGSPWSLSDDGYYISCKRDKGYIVEPIYTAPPQRKPLAEGQINDLMAGIDPEDVCSWSFRQGVYAAEKHHGVKP